MALTVIKESRHQRREHQVDMTPSPPQFKRRVRRGGGLRHCFTHPHGFDQCIWKTGWQ